jgi:hypothetical protein
MQKLIPVIQLWKKRCRFSQFGKETTKEFDIKNMPRIS